MAADSSFADGLADPDVAARPLCIALDGGLVSTRVGWERVVLLFRQHPWTVFAIPFKLLGGRARFRQWVRDYVTLAAATLPYRPGLVTALQRAREGGRKIILTTRADQKTGNSVAEHAGVFDSVFATGGTTMSLVGVLNEACPDGFDYVGHSVHDIAELTAAKRGFLLAAAAPAVRAAARLEHVSVVSRRPSMFGALVKELRPHQWAKNALVMLPVLVAPGLPELVTLLHGVLATLAFSLCASAGYVFNDLLDLDADRLHPSKARRPFASGALPIVAGFPVFLVLLAASFSLSLFTLPLSFVAMLILYFIGTLWYSLHLKRLLLLDVLVLAGLYTHRILSGGMATSIHVSAWLLGFSMFFFTSMAFAKRFVELHAQTSEKQVKNRGYSRVDLPMVTGMGTASGYIAALVFMLYVDSNVVRKSYREPWMLWLVLPALLYWLGRVWLLAGRGQMQEDPVKFALKDRTSLVCVLLIAFIMLSAKLTPLWLSNLFH